MPKREISSEDYLSPKNKADRELGREITGRYKRPQESENAVDSGRRVPKRNRLDELDGDTGDKDYEITGED